MERYKSIISLILLISVFSVFFIEPFTAQAQDVEAQGIGTAIVDGVSCVSGGVLSRLIMGWIGNGLKQLSDWLIGKGLARIIGSGVIGENSIFGKFLAGLGGIIADVVPTEDNAQIKQKQMKEYVHDLIARCAARTVMNEITRKMIGAVRTSGSPYEMAKSGYSPAFVRNWRRFMDHAERRGENLFRAVLGSAEVCPYLYGVKTALGAAGYGSNNPQSTLNQMTRSFDPYRLLVRCKMPRGWSYTNFQNDYASNGGWDALIRLSQPEHTVSGLVMRALGESDKQIFNEKQYSLWEALSGGGFTSRRGSNPQDKCQLRTMDGKYCIIDSDILTPGSVLGDTVSAVLHQELAWLTSVDEWNELITVLTARIMSRILNLADSNDTAQENFPRERYPGFTNTDDWSVADTPTTIPPTGTYCNNNGSCDSGEGYDCADCQGDICVVDGYCDTANYENEYSCPADCPPSGGGGSCTEPIDYEDEVQQAVANVVNNTNLEDGARDNLTDTSMFMDAVVIELRNIGLNAGRVSNPVLRDDTLIVGNNPPDPYGEVFDLIVGVGGPGRIGDHIAYQCVDDGDWSWLTDPAGGGGGGSGSCADLNSSPRFCTDGGDMSSWPRADVSCFSVEYVPPGCVHPTNSNVRAICPTGGCVIVNSNSRYGMPATNTPSCPVNGWPLSIRRDGSQIYSQVCTQPDWSLVDCPTVGNHSYDLFTSFDMPHCGLTTGCTTLSIDVPGDITGLNCNPGASGGGGSLCDCGDGFCRSLCGETRDSCAVDCMPPAV